MKWFWSLWRKANDLEDVHSYLQFPHFIEIDAQYITASEPHRWSVTGYRDARDELGLWVEDRDFFKALAGLALERKKELT